MRFSGLLAITAQGAACTAPPSVIAADGVAVSGVAALGVAAPASVIAALAVAALGVAAPAAAQVAEGAPDTTTLVADSGDVLGEAQAAQSRFERRRLRYLPLTLGTVGGECDEHVGRFCTWYEEGEWYPMPERPEVGELRSELLVTLDSLQRMLPGEAWILGQRVWYRAEAERWEEALAVARRCGDVEPWWCSALEGFALHGLERYVEAERAFERALAGMEPERAVEWRLPERAVDSDARELLDDLVTRPDSLWPTVERLWQLADPLHLVEGNDRLTAHYARWAVSTLREDARNPFHIRWGSDLEELTVRHGWEIGWERAPQPGFTALDHVVGHKHPEGRDYMPAGRALADPASARAEDLVAGRGRPRSLYAPSYAPVLLPMDAQLATFPRGGTMLAVATYFLPDDTTFHADHTHDVAWMEPKEQAGMPDRAGLFLVPAGGGEPLERRAVGSSEGVLAVEAPAGAYVVSAELWSPSLRRAGRLRAGVVRDTVPEDVAVLSDILMVEPAESEPERLEDVLALALPRTAVAPERPLAIAWEVAGLGFRAETLRFELSVERMDRGVFRRVGEILGLAERPQPLELSWEEPGPDQPTHHFRYLELDLPPLDAGDYRIRLALSTVGRSDAVVERAFTVVEPEER